MSWVPGTTKIQKKKEKIKKNEFLLRGRLQMFWVPGPTKTSIRKKKSVEVDIRQEETSIGN